MITELAEGGGKALLLMKGSITAVGAYTASLLKRFSSDHEPTLTLLGGNSSDSESNRHQGHPGWSFSIFLQTRPEAASPFLFEDLNGKPTFNFERYLQEVCGGNTPDFITLFLGTNDIFALTPANRLAQINRIIAHASEMISQIQAAAPKARIGLITPLPSASQDAFGTNYANGQTARTYRFNQQAYAAAFLKAFGNREREGLFIIPAALQFDPLHGYPTSTTPIHAQSKVMHTRQSNALHPNAEGHAQIADALYAWIKNQLQGPPYAP